MEAHLDWAGEIRVMLISGNRGRALLMLLAATKSLLSVKVISLLLLARMIGPVLLQKELYLVPAGVRVVKKIIANKKSNLSSYPFSEWKRSNLLSRYF